MRITVISGARRCGVDCADGEDLLSVLRKNGFLLPAGCGGRGTCGKCRVRRGMNDAPRDGGYFVFGDVHGRAETLCLDGEVHQGDGGGGIRARRDRRHRIRLVFGGEEQLFYADPEEGSPREREDGHRFFGFRAQQRVPPFVHVSLHGSLLLPPCAAVLNGIIIPKRAGRNTIRICGFWVRFCPAPRGSFRAARF